MIANVLLPKSNQSRKRMPLFHHICEDDVLILREWVPWMDPGSKLLLTIIGADETICNSRSWMSIDVLNKVYASCRVTVNITMRKLRKIQCASSNRVF